MVKDVAHMVKDVAEKKIKSIYVSRDYAADSQR